MKMTYSETTDYNDKGKEEFMSIELWLTCKNEAEFDATFAKIKGINGVVWSGCPDVSEDGTYTDMISIVKKTRFMTKSDAKLEMKEIRAEIKEALKK